MAGFWSRKWGEFPRHEYQVWYSMISRCCNRHHPYFARYGGRGIRVCDRWRQDFMAFLSDMGPRPTRAYTLDRLYNNRDYEPENCRWATVYQQVHNKEPLHNAIGVERHGRWWRARIGIGGRFTRLGSFETFEEAQEVYRQAALRNRIVAELSAAWARDSGGPVHGRADDGSLDRRLLNLLLEASCPPGASARRETRLPRSDKQNRRRKAPSPSKSSARATAARRKAKAKRS